MTDRAPVMAGECSECHGRVDAYEQDALPLSFLSDTTRLPPPRPITADPCGHVQTRPVVWYAPTVPAPFSPWQPPLIERPSTDV